MNRLLIFGLLLIPSSFLTAQETNRPFRDKILPALFNKSIQVELELAEDQRSKLQKLLDRLQESRSRISQKLRSFSRSGISKKELEEHRKEFVAKLEEEKKEVEADALDVLLPHQVKRLEQVTVQVMLKESTKQNKNQTGLLSDEIVQYLKIDKRQKNQIQEKSKLLADRLAQKIKMLTVEANEELLKELSAEQRKKYKELVGDPLQKIR